MGEPLSTILVLKLAGPPYYADFLFPLQTFGAYIIPGIIALAIFGSLYIGRHVSTAFEEGTHYSENIKEVFLRSIKLYIFIAALILLGEGLKPLFALFLYKIPSMALYWINAVSAFLDNATLTAIEINPKLALSQIVSAIIALLISGGILIPGNIPNIVIAGRLRITMREWAIIGIPLGLTLMSIYFVAPLPSYI